jgi:hypothetical protein
MVTKKVSKSGDAGDDQPRAPEVQDVLGLTDDVEEASDAGGSETAKEFTKINQHIITLCGFAKDPVMVEVIKQQGWTELEHVTTITFDVFKDLCLLRDDGMYIGCLMMVQIRMLKAFLHYYKRRSRGRTCPHNEDDVLEYTKLVFNEYCRSDLYTKDVSTGGLS